MLWGTIPTPLIAGALSICLNLLTEQRKLQVLNFKDRARSLLLYLTSGALQIPPLNTNVDFLARFSLSLRPPNSVNRGVFLLLY